MEAALFMQNRAVAPVERAGAAIKYIARLTACVSVIDEPTASVLVYWVLVMLMPLPKVRGFFGSARRGGH